MIASLINNGKAFDYKVKVVPGSRFDQSKIIGGSLVKLGQEMQKEMDKVQSLENWGRYRQLVKSGQSMLSCGSFAFIAKRTKAGKEEKKIMVHECRQRGCTPCSNAMNQDHVTVINEMVNHFGVDRFQFLVVTTPAVKVGGCRGTFNSLNKSIQDLSRLPVWKAYCAGFAKSIEGNVKDSNSVNPHGNLFALTRGNDLRNNKSVKRYMKNSPFFVSSMEAYLSNNPSMSKEQYLKKVQSHLKKGQFYQPMLTGILQSVGMGAVCRVVNAYDNPGFEFAKYLTKGFGVDSVHVASFLYEMKRFRLFSYFGELKKFKSEFRKDAKEQALLDKIEDNLDPIDKPVGVLLVPSKKNWIIPPDCKDVLFFIKGDGKGNTKQYVKRIYLDGSEKWFRICRWVYDCTAKELIARAIFYEAPVDILLMGEMQESKRFDVEILCPINQVA